MYPLILGLNTLTQSQKDIIFTHKNRICLEKPDLILEKPDLLSLAKAAGVNKIDGSMFIDKSPMRYFIHN